MLEANYKVPGGKLIKVKLSVSSDKIEQVRILGDFFLHPEETILTIEESLLGSKKDEKSIQTAIEDILKESDATLIGATAADFSKTIMLAWESK
ncbi:MAG: lipoate protein ligase C-terminal domain-containing protein [Candidatus Thorarchaeota archaeon]